jgi:hypothetical protein
MNIKHHKHLQTDSAKVYLILTRQRQLILEAEREPLETTDA